MVGVLMLFGFGPAAEAAQVGFKAHAYTGFGAETSGGAITGQKPESKLWYHDAKWWAVMLSPTQGGFHTIWRLDTGGWVNTSVVVETRPATKEDVLWTGSKLYIASRTASASGSNMLRRFTYSGGNWVLDSGFPVVIPGNAQETLTIARDSTGKLWVTYEKGLNIYVAHSLDSDTSWGAEFQIPLGEAQGVKSDDISTIISFTDATGPAIGVMWSNQEDDKDYFAVHRDGAADSSWTVETTLAGSLQAEDHINLKTFEGRVYAAVKTEVKTGAGLIKLLVRSTTGGWTQHNVATFAEGNTRPITVLNISPGTRKIHVFMTKGEGSSATGIAYKQTGIDAPSFPAAATTFIMGANNEVINDATSTKQNMDDVSGIVVLASDGTSYWWNRLGGGTPSQPPTATGGSATTIEDTPVTITLNGSDPDTCELSFAVATAPAHGTLGAITPLTCTDTSPKTDKATVTYTPTANYAGPDSFTFTVNDGTTSSGAGTISLTISAVNDAPAAAASTTNTTTDTPVVVTLNGSDFETCELTFAIGTAPGQGSLGAITNQACTTGTPKTDRAMVTYTPASGYTGADSFTFTVNDGTVTSPPASIGITIGAGATGITLRSTSSAANAMANTLIIPAPSGMAPGDVMVAGITVGGNPTVTPPSGWTLIRLDATSEFDLRQAMFWKVVASEPASYTFTFSSTQAAAGGIQAYAGVDTAAPINAHGGKVDNLGRTTAINAPSITTTANGAMLVAVFGIARNTTIAPPTGMTERWDIASTAGPFFATSEGCNALQTTAGATGIKTATSAITGPNIGQIVALSPAGAGPPPSPSPSPSPSPTNTPRG